MGSFSLHPLLPALKLRATALHQHGPSHLLSARTTPLLADSSQAIDSISAQRPEVYRCTLMILQQMMGLSYRD
jgi:hypothetical protein